MPLGPGKYDDMATYVREATNAQGVVVIVTGGNKGEGFSVQATPALTMALPRVLRSIANQVEQSFRQGKL